MGAIVDRNGTAHRTKPAESGRRLPEAASRRAGELRGGGGWGDSSARARRRRSRVAQGDTGADAGRGSRRGFRATASERAGREPLSGWMLDTNIVSELRKRERATRTSARQSNP